MKFFLFTADLNVGLRAEEAGIDSIIIDWETEGKEKRQIGYDTEINKNTLLDVEELAKNLTIPIIVRVNFSKNAEIDYAINSGASIIMLPMARSALEVENFLHYVGDRAKTIIQIETLDLIEDIKALSKLDWDYAYVGLNDLTIEKKEKCIWSSVRDRTVEQICHALSGRKYGFGGLTVLGGGSPVNTELLLHEYIRLGCSIGLLRRTFFKELQDRNMKSEISLVRQFLKISRQRGPKSIDADHHRLMRKLDAAIGETN